MVVAVKAAKGWPPIATSEAGRGGGEMQIPSTDSIAQVARHGTGGLSRRQQPCGVVEAVLP